MITVIAGLRHATKSTWFFTSNARPAGVFARSLMSNLPDTCIVFASIAATAFVSSRSTKIRPLPSVTACSGAPPRSIVPTIDPSFASITVACGREWLNTHTRWLNGSSMMPSGLPCTSIVVIGASVLASHIATGLLLEKPCPDFGSTATPRALVFAISPAGASVSRSKTAIRASVPVRGMYSRRPVVSAYT